MKNSFTKGCLLLALLGLYPAAQALAQTAPAVEVKKAAKAKDKALKPAKVRTPATAKPAKAEKVKLEPSKAPAVATQAIKVAPSAAANTTTTIYVGKVEEKELSKEEMDSLVEAGVIKTMTHEEILEMQREREANLLTMIGKPAPAFSATDLNGRTYTLEELKGKTVVLNFWFIGCKPCVMEMPHLNELVAKYKSEDIVFLALALDEEAELQKFLQRNPFHYNFLPDAGKIARDAYGVNSFPTSMVIDKAGVLRSFLTGYSEDVGEQLIAMIEQAKQPE